MTDPIEAVANAIKFSTGCGLTLNDEDRTHVLCTDPRLPADYRRTQCDCLDAARAAIAAYTKVVCSEAAYWQCRFRKLDGVWTNWIDGRAFMNEAYKTHEYEERPLFAAPQPAPSGYKLVPVEPTEEMLIQLLYDDMDMITAREVYRDLLKAAPEAGE